MHGARKGEDPSHFLATADLGAGKIDIATESAVFQKQRSIGAEPARIHVLGERRGACIEGADDFGADEVNSSPEKVA